MFETVFILLKTQTRKVMRDETRETYSNRNERK
jgi:hypothetical protein